jgi:hypothetical protein
LSKIVRKHPDVRKLLKISDIQNSALIPGTVILCSGTETLPWGTVEVVSGYGRFAFEYGERLGTGGSVPGSKRRSDGSAVLGIKCT